MFWKTLMTVVTHQEDGSVPDPKCSALEAAIQLARREDAHLEILALGYDLSQPGYYFAGASLMVLQESLTRIQASTAELESALRKRLRPEDIRWSMEQAMAQVSGLSPLISARARFVDLLVLQRPYGPTRSQSEETILETALFDAKVPVLIVPDEFANLPSFDHICLAWNNSPEALSAIRQALPVLIKAKSVDITIVDPPANDTDRSNPGGALSQWLARHGVQSKISVLARSMPKVSDVLMRHAREQSCDLLVMGAYGHSRFREAILGGATRDILEETKMPVFMAH